MKIRDCRSYTLWLFFNAIIVSCCLDTEEEDASLNLAEPQNLINPLSLYYDRTSKKMLNAEEFNQQNRPKPESLPLMDKVEQNKHRINDNMQERVFYMRLVNLLLSSMKTEVDKENVIIGTVTLKISASQVKTLNNAQLDDTPLREIDAIMSDIIRKPNFQFLSETVNVAAKFVDHTRHFFRINFFRVIEENAQILIVTSTTVILLLFARPLLRVSLSRGLPICVLIQIIFVTSFFMTWMQLVKEAEIKLTAQQRIYSDIPISCMPDKMNMWHKFVATVFPTNDCEKYYEALMANANLKVTPVLALSHMLSTIILHPVSIIGTVISEFIENSTSQLSVFYGWIVKICLFVCIGAVIIILPLCISGASFYLGLGPLFKFGMDFKKKGKEQDSIKCSKQRQPVKIIREIHHVHSASAIENTLKAGELKAIASANSYRVAKIKSGKNLHDAAGDSKDVAKYSSCSSESSEDEYFDSSEANDIIVKKKRRKGSNNRDTVAGDACCDFVV